MIARLSSHALALLGLGTMLGLSACGGKGSSAQEILGVSRSGPDAFNVVSRPPLTVPPDFALRPPAPAGTPGPGETDAEANARLLLTGADTENDPLTLGGKAPRAETAVTSVSSAPLGSAAERSLLERIGAQSADNNIREQLASDLRQKGKDESWIDNVVPSFRKKKDDTLDPVEETERLREGETKDVVQAPPDELLPAVGKAAPNYQPNVAKGADAKKAAAKGDFGVGLAKGRQTK